jgi:flagellar operon protein
MLDARHISLQLGIRPGGSARGNAVPGKALQNFQSPLSKPAGPSFQECLDRAAGEIRDAGNESAHTLRFSKHAQKRLASRNIELTSGDLAKIEQAVDTARRKGGRDSLVLMGDLALVVSIKNNTVITAVDENSSKENVFTNIDSAVIAR